MQSVSLHCSRLPLATICSASTIPPTLPIASSSPEATLGTALHHLAAGMVQGQHFEAADVAQQFGADAEELEILARCAWRVWEQLRERFPAPMVEERLELTQARGPKLTGILDLLALIHDGTDSLWSRDMPSEARILDWKSGHSDDDHEAQMRGYAYLVIRRWPSVRRVYTVVARVRDQSWEAQYHERESLERWWMDFTRRLEREPLPYNAGSHCRWCPRALECPARMAMLEQAMGLVLAAHATGQAADYVQLWVNAKSLQGEIEKVLDMVRAQVAISGGSLPAGDGYELRLVEQQRRTILPTLDTWYALHSLLRQEQILETITIHKSKVEQVVRANVPEDAPRGAKKEAVEELHRRLEEAGAWSVQRIEKLELKKINQLESAHENAK